ncbi:MAG: response regulator transcription factor [Clostridium sp.]|nr:response regulator transcription factor [Clostridium sp.]
MDRKARILLVEDDISLIDGLKYSLQKNGFEPEIAMCLREAYDLLEKSSFDLLLLDVNLPDGTGFELCGSIRRRGSRIPVIFLTALDEEVNIIRGLDGGGDDYITKPFKLGELCSRVNALLRRSGLWEEGEMASSAGDKADGGKAFAWQRPREETSQPLAEGMLTSGPVAIDLLSCRVSLNGEGLELTNAEYRLLCLLVKNANRTLTRSMILNAMWDDNGNFVDDNTLSVYIRRLREKVESNPSSPRHLLTIRGFGYSWKE